MLKAIISDSSRTLVFPKDKSITGSLNSYYLEVKERALSGSEANFDVFDYFEVNTKLLEFISSLTVAKYVFTTGAHIQNDPQIAEIYEDHFEKVFREDFADGLKKTDPQTFTTIARKLGFKPEEIIYIDDSEVNISAAQSAGYQTVKVGPNGEVVAELEQLFPPKL